MAEIFKVDTPGPLIGFLKVRLDSWRVNTLRDRVSQGCVRVNGEIVSRDTHPLEAGDQVEIWDPRSERDIRHALAPIHNDADLIVIDKPAGLLSVSSDRQRTRTALAMLKELLSPSGRPVPLWPVHRIDRETSGVLLFARSREVQETLQASWKEAEKIYLPTVEGHPKPEAGTIDKPLWEDPSLNVRVSRRPEARKARTHYRTVKKAPERTLLEVRLETGRRHQIRAHLAWIGHPVTGDRRYGTSGPRMGLHALRLSIKHPRDGKPLVFEAPPPRAFSSLLTR